MTSVLYRLSRMPMILATAIILLLPVVASASGEGKLSLPLLVDVISTLDLTYSAGAIQSASKAEQAIVEANKTKNDLLKWYAQAEQACTEKFFVTSCLNDIKLVRRDKLGILQRINVEAKAWQRKQRIEQLDEKLQEKNSQK